VGRHFGDELALTDRVTKMEGADRRSSSVARRRTRTVAIAVGLLAVAVLAVSCSDGSSSSSKPAKTPTPTAAVQQATATPAGAEAAVSDYLQSQGIEYAGDCATAKLPQDKGKWCSTLLDGTNNDQKVYGVGPVGEKSAKMITTKRQGSAQLTPGFQVGVAEGNVGNPSQLTREELEADTFITGNLILDQAAGIGNGIADLPTGAQIPTAPTGGGGGGAIPAALPPVVVDPGAVATDYVPPPNGIVVQNPTIQVLGAVVFRGAGCAANEPLQVLFDGTPIGTIAADPQGKFAGSVSVPRGTAPGVHASTVKGATCSFNASITVLGQLAFTGSSSHTGTYVLGALAAIVVGFVLVVGSRRRRQISAGQQPPSGAA
jgi:hypothetical protein